MVTHVDERLVAVRESLNSLQDQIEALKARPAQLQKESTDAMRRLQEVRKELRGDSPASDEPRPLAEARMTALIAEHALLIRQGALGKAAYKTDYIQDVLLGQSMLLK